MASLKLLVTIIVTLALGATGVATVAPPSSIAANVDAALGRVTSTLGLETRAQVGTHLPVQNGKASAGAAANGQANTQTTVSTPKKKGNTQTTSNTAVNANSNANANTNVNANANINTNAAANVKTNSSTNAAVNTNTAAGQDDGSLKVASAIANEFSVAVNDVTALHNQGWGYGEIEKLYEMAKESGASVSLIESMRASGKGWGEIAEALNLSVSGAGKNLGAIISGNGSLNLGHK